MKPDPDIKVREEDERGSLRLKVSELERKLREEKTKLEIFQAESELGKLLAFKETEKYTRELSSLQEQVRRSEDDLKTLRGREAADRERIKQLLKDIETKDREFNVKSLEFEVDKRVLECAKRRVQDEAREWMDKFASLKSRESTLLAEISRLKRKANSFERAFIDIDTDDEEPPLTKRIEGCAKRKCREEDDGAAQKKMSACVAFSKRYAVDSEVSISEHVGAKEPSTVAVDIQSSVLTANKELAQVTDTRLSSFRQRYPRNLSRPVYAGRIFSSEPLTRAKEIQSKLNLGNPSFIKRMLLSHVSRLFWLTLPIKFCLENQLPCCRTRIILEDEEGQEYKAFYIGDKNSFNFSGWKHFASAHCLEVGDALIFELTGPTRFKVYIVRENLKCADDTNKKISALPWTKKLGKAPA